MEEYNVTRSKLPRVCLQHYPCDGKREIQKTAHLGSLKCTHFPFNARTHSARTTTLICAAALVCSFNVLFLNAILIV